MKADEQQIRELIAKWHEYTRRGDVESVLELMTDDVLFTVVGRPPFGKAEFAEASRQMAGMKLETEHEIEEVTVRADSAWSRVRLRVSVTNADGKELRREGYTLSIYVKVADGRWLLARDANLLGPQR
jgi:uncharacterized protein (TIGR02246 family)